VEVNINKKGGGSSVALESCVRVGVRLWGKETKKKRKADRPSERKKERQRKGCKRPKGKKPRLVIIVKKNPTDPNRMGRGARISVSGENTASKLDV